MSKSSFLNNKVLNKSNIAFICILLMMVGFLGSTAVSSISMFLFCVNAVWGINPKRWLENKWWLLGLVWLLMIAISYFWSDDKAHWERSLQVKLPFLLFPVAWWFMPPFSSKQLQWLTLLMGAVLLSGVIYSLSFLVKDPALYILNYNFSHLLPTPCYQDHVRFSMAISLFFVWCVYIWRYFQIRFVKWSITFLLILFILYIHILAAKSGLVAFYLFILAWGIYISFVKKKVAGLIIIISIPLFLLFAITYMPTFRARLAYLDYAWVMLKTGDRSGNYGDIGRLMSYKLALHLIREHPWTGVGAGDVMTEMKKGYDQYYPQVEDKARLVPHNQLLIIGMGCGIPAMLVFSAWLFYPLTWLRRNRQSFFFFMVWLLLLTQLLIEPVLEVQNGVFVYLFFLLWQRQQLPNAGITNDDKHF